MKTTLTITSKGQTTIPAPIRKALGVDKGGILYIDFNERNNKATIEKPLTIDEISAKYSKLIKPGTPPLTDVHTFYQTREPRV
ncbi:MAG TPA: AbrB/MazE/SpoVT family DNA-binding domain-containing protein [Candidatus Saccharimonadales bacterium]